MSAASETVTVGEEAGFVRVSVDRRAANGARYQSALYFQRGDLAALADALEAFTRTGLEQTVTLADGALRVFGFEPSPMINLELTRPAELPFGGYDTLDLGPASAGELIATLRAG